MAKIQMLVELEYDPDLMHGNSRSGYEWFRRFVLLNAAPPLILHSNDVGDSIGELQVLKILDTKQETENSCETD